MKVPCKARRNVIWAMVAGLAAGVAVLLRLTCWAVRLMPRAVGGDGVFAWAELAERTCRVVRR